MSLLTAENSSDDCVYKPYVCTIDADTSTKYKRTRCLILCCRTLTHRTPGGVLIMTITRTYSCQNVAVLPGKYCP